MPDKEFLILGKGLAGSVLAIKLAMAGRSFEIIHSEKEPCASEKAAGLMNPVTGRRMALTWNFEAVWREAEQFYAAAYLFLKKAEGSFLVPRTIRKALFSIEEMNFLEAKSAWAGFGETIGIHAKTDSDPALFSQTVGWADTRTGYRLDAPAFLRACSEYFSTRSLLSESEFRKENLKKLPDGWLFQGKTFRNVVSCLGLGCPWIAPELWPVKGQMFVLEGLPDWGTDVLKTAHFFIPEQGKGVLAGSTSEREFSHPEPDAEGFESITGGVNPELLAAARIADSWAGIRPTSKDRRPVIREIQHALFAINGLGTKGVSLAPYAAGTLLHTLISRE